MNNSKDFKNIRSTIEDYLNTLPQIPTGFNQAEKIKHRQHIIMQKLNANFQQWSDYSWQIANRITDAKTAARILNLDDKTVDEIKKVSEVYRFAISPYYLSLIDMENDACPIRRQALPAVEELINEGELDPMGEAGSSPVEGVTRRYPDRLIIKVTNQCGMYCRFCQRRRLIGETDRSTEYDIIKNAINYVRENSEIRDVLITGGDALTLDDDVLEHILKELRAIKHVEIIRLGTRAPVTLPQRITPQLAVMLKRYHPLYINTQFNSPMEITAEAKQACDILSDAGIPLGNQMVLLNGVNNDKHIVRRLNQLLLTLRVKPYYIFHPKTVRGTSHFWVQIGDGLEIMESLRGYTSGLAVPTYIVNGPKGLGKTPMLPSYLLYIGKDKAVFRSWDNKIFEIENKCGCNTQDFYEI